MIIGNITISSKPREDDLRSGVICSSCFEECEEVPVDDSFDDQFGNVECWGVGSNCCGAECFEGRLTVNVSSVHTARKDHVDKKGNVTILKGQRYRANLQKGYYIDDSGDHHGIYNYWKKIIIEKSK